MSKVSDLFQRAVAALSNRNMDRAEQLTREVLEIDATNIEAWSLLANIYHQSERLEEALEPAIRTTELDPDNPQHWNTLGYFYLLLHRWKEGEQCYARATTMPDVPATFYLNHAWALIELGQDTAATQQLQKALEHSLKDELIKTIQQEPKYTKLRTLLDQLP